jgi:hypothetical protein
MDSYFLPSTDSIGRKQRDSRAPKMTFRSILAILLTGFLAYNNKVQAADDKSKVLLETNALGYTEHDRAVAYSDIYVFDHERKGECVNGLPPDTLNAPDVQTTTTDSTCQALVRSSFHHCTCHCR